MNTESGAGAAPSLSSEEPVARYCVSWSRLLYIEKFLNFESLFFKTAFRPPTFVPTLLLQMLKLVIRLQRVVVVCCFSFLI